MAKRIFISKNASEIDSYQAQFEKLGFETECHSFLSYSAVDFDIEHPYEVIFFGSPRSVIFFLNQSSINSSVRVACIGAKTKEILESIGINVDFMGEKSGHPSEIAKEFETWAEGKRVLFPLSDRSLKSISSLIPPEQKEEVVVYETTISEKEISPCMVYVFTSPSNVEGFFKKNQVTRKSIVIAWGNSTKSALEEVGITVNKSLNHSRMDELISLL